ncbi:winged helix-turn-helix transcriptional regulator [Candidatus Kaiserbacteria bacterium]|nr:winged helix-turn-helix transcriptional regulator [Candidatus Kaiserbacteria bacterium]
MADKHNYIVETERVFKALANRRRLMIVQLLRAKGRRDVGSIAEHIRLSFAATSRHLRVLANADLVESEQVNTTVNYYLPRSRNAVLDTALRILQ